MRLIVLLVFVLAPSVGIGLYLFQDSIVSMKRAHLPREMVLKQPSDPMDYFAPELLEYNLFSEGENVRNNVYAYAIVGDAERAKLSKVWSKADAPSIWLVSQARSTKNEEMYRLTVSPPFKSQHVLTLVRTSNGGSELRHKIAERVYRTSPTADFAHRDSCGPIELSEAETNAFIAFLDQSGILREGTNCDDGHTLNIDETNVVFEASVKGGYHFTKCSLPSTPFHANALAVFTSHPVVKQRIEQTDEDSPPCA